MYIEQKQCYFCANHFDQIDFKDVDLLRRFINPRFKIVNPRRTGTCTRHQRKLAEAIKRARFMALLPYTLAKR